MPQIATSGSSLVETLLDLIASPPKAKISAPVLAKLRGSLRRRLGCRLPQASRAQVPVTRILLDVNVVLDVLLDRRPFADAASAVWSEIEEGEVRKGTFCRTPSRPSPR